MNIETRPVSYTVRLVGQLPVIGSNSIENGEGDSTGVESPLL